MTTGSYGSNVTPSGSWTGFRSYKNWNGDNGKYEVSPLGFVRTKWNPYTLEHKSLRVIQSKVTCICPYGYTESFYLSGYNMYNTLVGSPADPNEELKAIQRIINKVKGHSFNAGVSLAEAGEFATMVVDNLSSLARAAVLLRHGRFEAAARQLRVEPRHNTRERMLKVKDIGSRWLELQYGWLPTLSDTYAAAQAFAAITKGQDQNRFGSRYTWTTKRSLSSITGWQCCWDEVHTRSLAVRVESEVGLNRQLGLYDPLSIAWEVLPYSFVADWFIPIGTYLSDLNQLGAIHGTWLTTTSAVVKGVYFTREGLLPLCSGHGFHHRYINVIEQPQIEVWNKRFNRSVSTSAPSLPFPRPKLIGAVHGKRVANAIALFYNALTGGRAPRRS